MHRYAIFYLFIMNFFWEEKCFEALIWNLMFLYEIFAIYPTQPSDSDSNDPVNFW